jgi:hypothetical protein
MTDLALLPFGDWSSQAERDEPAHGYFCRLVSVAGASSVRSYSTMIDVNGRHFVPEDMHRVISELPLDAEVLSSLAHATPVLRGAEYTLCGERFSQRDISYSTRRRCPACIYEKPYHRTWWDIVAITRCPYHGMELVDTDASGRKVGWSCPDFDVTDTGEALGVAGVPHALRDDTFARYMLGRLGYEARQRSDFLDDISTMEVIVVCDIFGKLLPREWAERCEPRDADTVDHGYRALKNGLAVLRGHVVRWLLTAVPRSVLEASASKVFTWAVHSIRKIPNKRLRLTLNNVLRSALAEVVTGAETGAEQEHGGIYLTEVARRLGVRRNGLYALVDSLASGKRRSRRRLKLAPSQVEKLAEHVATLSTRVEAAKALGLVSWDLTTLEQHGVLTGIRNLSAGGPNGARFLKRDIDRLLEQLDALPPATGSGIALLTYARKIGKSSGEVAAEILQGRLAAGRIASAQPGFKAVRIADPRFGYARRQAMLDDGRVSVAEAMALTNLDHATVKQLAQEGQLGAEFRNGVLRALDSAAVKEFAERFRPLAEFAAVTGVDNVGLAERLRADGIEFLPSKLGPNVVVDRKEALSALKVDQDPTVIRDTEFASFWTSFTEAARVRCPHFKLPPTLPTSGQRVWRSDRKASVTIVFDPGSRRITAVINAVKPAVGLPEGLEVRLGDGPEALVGFLQAISAAIGGAAPRARSPPPEERSGTDEAIFISQEPR